MTSAILFTLAGSMIVTSCHGTGETEVKNNALVSLSFDETKGSVTASKTEGRAGDTVVLTISPNQGYVVSQVMANGTVLEGPEYMFLLVEGQNNVSVTFEVVKVKVIVTGARNGVEGETVQLQAIVDGDPTNSVTWGSSNNFNATVSSTGLVTLISIGTVLITATSTLDPTKSSSPVEIQIYAKNTITKSLEIVNLPAKTKYKVGEQADFTGIEVMGYDYADGTKVYTSGVVFSKSQLTFSVAEGTTFNQTGDQTVHFT